MGGSRSLTLPVVAAPLGVCMKAPPTAAVRRLLHPSVCVPGQGSWPIQPISCPGKAARALRHVRYTPSSRSRGSKISDPPTSPLLGPLLPAFDWLRVLAHSVLLWLRLHRVSTSSYLPIAIPTSCVPRLLAVLSGIILSFFSAIFLFPATDQQCCLQSIPTDAVLPQTHYT